MRPIDADKFEEFIRENCTDSLVDLWCELVRRQPTIEAVPVVHGEWKYSPKENIATCKMCSYEHYLGTYHQYARNFCPNCGADMRKGGA